MAGALAGPRKKAADEGRTVVRVDQAGCYPSPLALRAWAPCGQTPVLPLPLPHDHRAAMGGIAAGGRLFMQTRDRAYRSPDVVRSLRLLLRTSRGQPLLIWDGAPIQRGRPVEDFLRTGAAHRLHLGRLPGSAPELNPDEGIGNALKRVELGNVGNVGNVCCPDRPALGLAVRRANERLRHKRAVIQACVRQAGYYV